MIANPAPAGREPGAPADVSAAAFTEEEVEALTNWVAQGGRLLLAADHAPYAGYSALLAAEFGATFHDGFARDTLRERGGKILFRYADETLRPYEITYGRVALFGEVWMFRYFNGGNPQLEGAQNSRFVLNLMRWLSGRSNP